MISTLGGYISSDWIESKNNKITLIRYSLIEVYEKPIFTKSGIWGQQYGEEGQASSKIVVKCLSVSGNQWKWVVIVVAG